MGKKLTAKQKIKLLEEVRSMLIREETNFICIAIEYIMAHKENRFFCNSYNAMARYVPEMLKYKPGKKNMIDGSSPWFHRGDIESRIYVIDNTIEDLEKLVPPSFGAKIMSAIKQMISKWKRN